MNRLSTIFAAMLFAMPIASQAVAPKTVPVLPNVITQALKDAASTGNPLVVDAVADRLTNLFPSYKTDIASYVDQVAAPATTVVAVIDTMRFEQPPAMSDDVFDMETSAGPDASVRTIASDLNNLDVGTGETVSAR